MVHLQEQAHLRLLRVCAGPVTLAQVPRAARNARLEVIVLVVWRRRPALEARLPRRVLWALRIARVARASLDLVIRTARRVLREAIVLEGMLQNIAQTERFQAPAHGNYLIARRPCVLRDTTVLEMEA